MLKGRLEDSIKVFKEMGLIDPSLNEESITTLFYRLRGRAIQNIHNAQSPQINIDLMKTIYTQIMAT